MDKHWRKHKEQKGSSKLLMDFKMTWGSCQLASTWQSNGAAFPHPVSPHTASCHTKLRAHKALSMPASFGLLPMMTDEVFSCLCQTCKLMVSWAHADKSSLHYLCNCCAIYLLPHDFEEHRVAWHLSWVADSAILLSVCLKLVLLPLSSSSVHNWAISCQVLA